MKNIICAVVVAYRQNCFIFNECINSIRKQLDFVVVIDNNDLLLKIDYDNVKLISFNANLGIAVAQNVGISYALAEGAHYVFLSDQDTIYPTNYVSEMIACLEKVSVYDMVAAVSPNFYDVNRSELCPMIVDAGPLGFKLKTATSGLHKVCFANASGMLIPAKVFAEVGLMREDLFIDCVDTEWCTRAEHLGYSIYCNADMVITHSLGDRSINVLGRVITQHSPLRHYYLARNSMYLALYSRHLTVNKRLFFLLRALKRVIGHAVLSTPRLENLSKGLLGLWHGVIGRLGKHD